MRTLQSKIIFVFLLILLCTGALSAQSIILSPSQGVWANYQSLVLDLPEDYEAYYSLSGENPLESGFAYDGPVLLELDGNVKIDIAVVDDSNVSQAYSVDYIVDVQPLPNYIPELENTAVIPIDSNRSLEIPSSIQYKIGSMNEYANGSNLRVSNNMIFERYIPITIMDGEIPYRYILQIGDSLNAQKLDSENTQIEITDWSYITFLEEGPIVYSIDDGALRQTNSGTIFVDRGQDRVLKWQKFDGELGEIFSTLSLPKKPEILGMPKAPIVNEGVTLSLSDSRYMFAYQKDKNTINVASVFYVDTLSGDAYGFSEKIDIYFDGIKQGSIRPTFIIDKIPPVTPMLTASSNSGYSRTDVTINIDATDTVYYYLPNPQSSKTGFLSTEYLTQTSNDFRDKSRYEILQNSSIHLRNSTNLALAYDVYVFSADNAGNTSEVVHYKTVIDPYNYYLKQKSPQHTLSELGTEDRPFTSLNALYNSLEGSMFYNIYVDGVFTNLTSINLNQDVSLSLTDSSRLIFSSGESISVEDASVSFFGGTIEQHNTEGQNLQNTLLSANNATITMRNTELLLSGGTHSNCIVLHNSSAQIINSGITVQTLAYGSGIHADNSVLFSNGSRYVLVAETAIGMSLVHTSAQIRDSIFTGVAPLGRGLEFINSNYSLINNSFSFENSQSNSTIKYPAIWVDESTIQNELENNSFEGFTDLIVKKIGN